MVCPPNKQVSGSPPGSYTKKYRMRSNPNLSFHFQPRGDVGARTNTKLGGYTDLYLVPEIGDGSPPHHGGQGDLPNLQGKTQGHLSQNPHRALELPPQQMWCAFMRFLGLEGHFKNDRIWKKLASFKTKSGDESKQKSRIVAVR